jgi:uncharacterized protein (TIGR02117 family)
MIKKILRLTGIITFSCIGFLLVYALSAFCFSRIIVNSDAIEKDDVTIYIMTNGVHTDLVLPVRNEIRDWSDGVKFENTVGRDSTANFVAFGWGDKGFYLETPTWADLKFSTAFSAAFALGESAMHTTFYKRMTESESCKAIKISYSDYKKLVDFIDSSFKRSEASSLIHIVTNANYGSNDAFYEAIGSYSLFTTCNTWANNGLKSCGQKASLWTPFDSGVFYPYQGRK